VRIELDGLTAQVHLGAEHAATRQVLEQAMPLLAGSLREAGLTLAGGGVFEQPRQPQPGTPEAHTSAAHAAREHDDTLPGALPTPVLRQRGVVDLVA
jgi:flagellar hook-length control protein FliK